MVFAVPLLNNRVAPRCSAADELLVVTVSGGRVTGQHAVALGSDAVPDVLGLMARWSVGTLVCGGLSAELRGALADQRVSVIDNVAGAAEDITRAMERGTLRPGFGLLPLDLPVRVGSSTHAGSAAEAESSSGPPRLDCLACEDRVCLAGRRCPADPTPADLAMEAASLRLLDAALDISSERERQLCRLAEVVYLGLELDACRVGLAFCIDLLCPAAIVAGVLRRFFDVVPVCCKISGRSLPEMAAIRSRTGAPIGTQTAREGSGAPACNPVGQAEVLNRAGTDLNVAVGLCIGVDCVFSSASLAPVTTLFVKDRSLANNPIGAVYSDYYLRESISPAGPEPARRGDRRRSQENVS